MIKAAIIDFDKTLTTADMTDLLTGLMGKQLESERLNKEFQEGKLPGISALVQRMNLLNGLSMNQLETLVAINDYLRPGAVELFEYFQSRGIVTIIASGSPVPFLELYQPKLKADYLVGSRPRLDWSIFTGITEQDYSGPDFKVRDSRAILDEQGIEPATAVAIGDSPADRGIFELAGTSIAIDPVPGVEAYVQHVIHGDLREAIPILEQL